MAENKKMKHIRKKFLLHDFINKNEENEFSKQFIEIPIPQEIDSQKVLKAAKGKVGIITNTNGEKIFSMVYNNSGTYCMIPIPDFSLMNFHQAYKYNRDRKELHKELMRHFENLNDGEYKNFAYAYDFQGCASACIIMLFTSIECFVNDVIPPDYEYKVEGAKKTEIYNKKQIQEFVPFMTKLKEVLPSALGKNFFSKQTPATSHINNLKDLRNDIIHTKSDPTGKKHAEILSKLLSFNMTKLLKL